ncbi:hypothetical protein AADM48_24975, partial [Escherichia coli]
MAHSPRYIAKELTIAIFKCVPTIRVFFPWRLNTYAKFWKVWDLFFDKVVTLCKDGDRYWYVDKIIKSYLFAES